MSLVSWSDLIQVGILVTNSAMVLLNCIMVFIEIYNKKKGNNRPARN